MTQGRLPAIPTDCEVPHEDGEPIFEEPWQARSFAMTLQLSESGVFTWREWADALSQTIADREKSEPIRDATGYYTAWQASLENLVQKKLFQAVGKRGTS